MTKDEYFELCYRIKGELIESVTLLEYQLTHIITYHREKTETNISDNLLYKIHKENKLFHNIDAALSILSKDYPEFLIKNATLVLSLHDIRKLRNEVAHSLLEISTKGYTYNRSDSSSIRFIVIESSKNNNTNIPIKAASIDSIKSDISLIKNTCVILGQFLADYLYILAL